MNRQPPSQFPPDRPTSAAYGLRTPASMPEYLAALVAAADDPGLDPASKALILTPPPVEEVIAHIAASGRTPDPQAVHDARETLERAIARALGPRLETLYRDHAAPGPYSPDAAAAGHRALRGRALALMTALDPEAAAAAAQYDAAGNMTERLQALTLLVGRGRGAAALARFHADWRHDRLVIDKWFAVQASATPPASAVAVVETLTRHPDFDWRNPNRFRALIGAFAGNAAGFHRADGTGYDFVTDWLIRLDPVNPQTTARLAGSFGTWRMFDARRQALMRGALERIAASPTLSRDTGEIVARSLRAEG